MSAPVDAMSLDEFLTEVSTSLMTVEAATLVDTCQLVLQRLVSRLQVDMSFVRRNDHDQHATVLVAEWPPRTYIPDPDPLGIVPFEGADAVFTALENLSEPLIARPGGIDSGYQERVRDGSGVMGVSTITIPMTRRGVTTGALGLIKFADRGWSPAEINTLTALAALLAQALSRVAAEQRLRYLAYHDELTELYSRRALLDHLAERLESGRPGPVPIMFIDVDRLKAMNDFLGNAAGDEYLHSLSRRLEQNCGRDDFAARFGGDELVVVLGSPTPVEAVVEAARELQTILGAPIRVGGDEVARTVSIGLAFGAPGGTDAYQLLHDADQAVVAAKSQGGNGVLAFSDQMRIEEAERTDVELHLRTAISTDQLVLHYQPQVDLVTGSLLGAEALVRWNHPARGLLMPDAFIGVAEATNLSGELGRWVISTACTQLAIWRAEFHLPDFRLAVNVSPAQLITTDLVGDVADALASSGVPAANLTVEITETAVVADPDRARETLRALADLGVHLDIDDFGSGYSSFAQLKTLPVHTLKIDRGFVTNIAENSDDQAIVRSIIDLAHAFGLDTMAEGVETVDAVATLVGLGCDRAQGYLISRPVPAGDLRPLLQRGRVPRSQLGGSDS